MCAGQALRKGLHISCVLDMGFLQWFAQAHSFNQPRPRQAHVHLYRVVTCLRQWKAKLVEAGFQELVFEDAMEVVIDQLNSLGTAEPLKVAMLEENMR